MAFLLPMFRHIKAQRPVENLEGPITLIMTPTRELAVQIYRESKPFLKALGIRAVCAYGGAPISEQIAEMKGHADKIKSMAFLPDNDSLISSSDDGTARVWSTVDVLRICDP